MKSLFNTLLVLSLSGSGFSNTFPRFHRRDVSCSEASVIAQIGGGNGGRKVGIVIDVSTSMADNDPLDVRLAAAKELNSVLITKAAAGNGKIADMVTVVDFSTTPTLTYPLGDPAGAVSHFDHLPYEDGTYIGGGISTALDELVKAGNDPTANRTAIAVFTDGEDNYDYQVQGTIEAIQAAGNQSIKVHFGYLSVVAGNQDPEIELAVLKTGGVFTTIDSANSTENFIGQVLLKGLTGIDEAGSKNTILSGLTTSALLTQTGQNKFTYDAIAGEKFNVTVSTKDDLNLVATLHDASANKDLMIQPANITDPAFMEYTAPSDMAVEIVVSATNATADGIFSIGLKSDLSRGQNCTITNTTTTITSPLTIATPTTTLTASRIIPSTTNAITYITSATARPTIVPFTGAAPPSYGSVRALLVSLCCGAFAAAFVLI